MGLRYTLIETSFGWVGVAGGEAGISNLSLPQASAAAALASLEASDMSRDDSAFGDLPQRLRRYFAGERVAFPDRLDLSRGTPFLRAVLGVARAIPYGEKRSYAAIAVLVGRPGTARAVGRAMATNPVPIIIPCHRVVGSDGSLVGFGGGLEMKRRLLDMEASGLA